MLRHLKRRQFELDVSNRLNDGVATIMTATHSVNNLPLSATSNQAVEIKKRNQDETKQQKRARGRRSSKPAMEKRRRARINECLDILKSYVLNDSTNLHQLGIDLNGGENQLDEESIARQILKTSGLINRHRGRKNPNKLEKADILELTVDYVRRLHGQRDELLSIGTGFNNNQQTKHTYKSHLAAQQTTPLMANNCLSYEQQIVPAHLNEPLTLDLSPKSRQTNMSLSPPMLAAYHPPPNTPLTPPSSSSSSSHGTSDAHGLSIQQQHQNQLTQMQLLSHVLDCRYKVHPNWISVTQTNEQ